MKTGDLVQTCEHGYTTRESKQFGYVAPGTLGIVNWADNVRGYGEVTFHAHGTVHMVPLHMLEVIPDPRQPLTECESSDETVMVDLPPRPVRQLA